MTLRRYKSLEKQRKLYPAMFHKNSGAGWELQRLRERHVYVAEEPAEGSRGHGDCPQCGLPKKYILYSPWASPLYTDPDGQTFCSKECYLHLRLAEPLAPCPTRYAGIKAEPYEAPRRTPPIEAFPEPVPPMDESPILTPVERLMQKLAPRVFATEGHPERPVLEQLAATMLSSETEAGARYGRAQAMALCECSSRSLGPPHHEWCPAS